MGGSGGAMRIFLIWVDLTLSPSPNRRGTVSHRSEKSFLCRVVREVEVDEE